MPFRVFLYDDQGRAGLSFARFTVSVKLYLRSCEDDRDVGPRKANALTVTPITLEAQAAGLASRGGCRKTKVIAPVGFLEAITTEAVVAGNLTSQPMERSFTKVI